MRKKKFPSWIHPSRHIDLPYILYAQKVLAGPGSVPRETGYTYKGQTKRKKKIHGGIYAFC